MKIYNYNSKDKNLTYDIRQADSRNSRTCTSYTLTFRSPYSSGIKENDTAYCELFTPEGLDKPLKLLIFLHGFSTRRKKLQNYYFFINSMASRGYACAFLNLPLHLNRTPEVSSSGEDLIYYDDMQTLEFFHQCVVDTKRLIDIMQNYCLDNIHICGLSMGSMVSVLAMAHEPRIEKGALLIGGGHWEEVHWGGILRFILKGNCADDGQIDRAKCHNYYSNFPKFLKQLKKTEPEVIDTDKPGSLEEHLTKKCFLCDPLAFAHRINRERVLMINARFDFYFSRNSTLKLWRELGKPEIHWLTNFHSSKIITDQEVISKIYRFLER
ncbi:MAG: alpha/beta hydrolase family protein [Actinomycetota bacterium]